MENLQPILLVIILGTINWLATALGATSVFFEGKKPLISYSNTLALSAGIMLAASFWSLLLPSVEMARDLNLPPWLVSGLGFILGILFLVTLSNYSEKVTNSENNIMRNINNITVAISIHNIPEGILLL